MEISLIIPSYNEEENIKKLYKKLKPVLEGLKKSYEIIFVDDGSTDESSKILETIAKENKTIKVILFQRNFGQTAALAAGFSHAKGRIIVTLDADLQNDPEDIPLLLEKIEEGFDVVSGWRRERKDAFWTKNLPSFFANKLISFVMRVYLHDYGCGLKAYRAEVVKPISLYGEIHRFLPALTGYYGARITEIPIGHFKRNYGKSHYNLWRVFKIPFDLLMVKFFESYFIKPMYVFGGLGFISFLIGILSFAGLLYIKIFLHISMIQSPLLLLTAMSMILAAMFVVMGFLAEILMRIYHEFQNKKPYLVKKIINL